MTEEENKQPLRVGILMLMPSATVERTEMQFSRFLMNAPFPVEPVFFYFDKHKSHSKQDYFDERYKKIADIKKMDYSVVIDTTTNNAKHLFNI